MSLAHAQGQLLAQVRPSVATPVTLFIADQLRVEITLIIACLTPGATTPLEVRLYHDSDGVAYDNNSIILHEQRLALIQKSILFQAQHPGSGIMVAPGGALGVMTAVANEVNFMVYGITESIAERVRAL